VVSDTRNLRWLADHDDPESVDDLFVQNATRIRMERMSEDFYWLMFEIDGVQYNIDLYIKPGSRKDGTKRRIVAFNRGELPPAEPR
jgi:hypothetical protein